MDKARILVIDDDPRITGVLKRGLSYEGYTVDTAGAGYEGLVRARDYTPDLLILDIGLPDIDGFGVLDRFRTADRNLPIMMLTARDGAQDQVQGLDHGADDYMVKPFSLDVLAARVKALLRRRELDHPEVLSFADLRLDTGLRRARRGARDIDLTLTEYEVLHQFLLHPRRVLPKYLLMERVWGLAGEGNCNVLEVYVRQLRQKLEAGSEPRLIHTSRGAGYVLREP